MKENLNFLPEKLEAEKKIDRQIDECNQNLKKIEEEIAMYNKKNGDKERESGFISKLLFRYRGVSIPHPTQQTIKGNSVKKKETKEVENHKDITQFKITKLVNNRKKKKRKKRKKRK